MCRMRCERSGADRRSSFFLPSLSRTSSTCVAIFPLIKDSVGRRQASGSDFGHTSARARRWGNGALRSVERGELRFVLSHISETRSPPHGRGPVRGGPGRGAHLVVVGWRWGAEVRGFPTDLRRDYRQSNQMERYRRARGPSRVACLEVTSHARRVSDAWPLWVIVAVDAHG